MRHNLGATMTNFRYPSAREIRFLEMEARRARSREMSRLLGAAAGAVKAAWAAFFTVKRVGHA
jgi:hypothetical protein